MSLLIGLLLIILAAVIHVDGFPASPDVAIIDCGSSHESFVDEDTGVIYSSDYGYIDSGINTEIIGSDNRSDLLAQAYNLERFPAQASNLGRFPNGIRNCYTINDITQGYKYLIRASFLYGNYDGEESAQITFDLYLGVDLWKTMNITEAYQLYTTEMITLATSNRFFVCLVRTSDDIPFISALEVRLIPSEVHYDVSHANSLRLLRRTNMGSEETIRRPHDLYDRIWFGEYSSLGHRYNNRSWEIPDTISTTSAVDATSRDPFAVPSVLMQTASKAHDNSTLMFNFSEYTNGAVPPIFYIYMHFAELEMIKDKNSREFQVIIPGVQDTSSTNMNNISLEHLVATNISIIHQYGSDPSTYYVNLTKAPGSTLAPILNAVEAYAHLNRTSVATDPGDAAFTFFLFDYLHCK